MYYEKIISKASNEWILFIHGLGGSINTWKKQIEDFKDKFNLIFIDLDGHGKSDDSYSDYKPKDCTYEINEILEEENIEKVNLVSLSLGTLVALDFTKRFPEKVSSSILAGCIINLDKKRQMLLALVQKIKNVFPKNFLYKTFASVIMPKKNHKKSREIFVKESLKMRSSSFIGWLDSFWKSRNRIEEYIKTLNKYEIPTLFIMGNEDYMFLKGIKDLKGRIKNFSLKIINDCGHVCSIEKSKIFNDLTLNFIFNKKICEEGF